MLCVYVVYFVCVFLCVCVCVCVCCVCILCVYVVKGHKKRFHELKNMATQHSYAGHMGATNLAKKLNETSFLTTNNPNNTLTDPQDSPLNYNKLVATYFTFILEALQLIWPESVWG